MSSAHKYAYRERLLTVDNLCVNYDKPILRNLSFSIDNVVRPGMLQGQILSLLGPSGMGKTQLFRCIAGLQKPTSGSVKLDSNSNEVKAGDVGVVMQHYPLLQHRTIMGNLNLITYSKEAKARAIELLYRFGLFEQKDKYPIQLSGGQRQRISIIQQLLCDSKLILMDEPFSGLDVLARINACKLINEISLLDETSSIIIVTHDIEYSLLVSDHIMMLGRDTAEDGSKIPGAKIQKTFDLIERDLAWHPDVEHRPNFISTLREIKDSFIHM